MQRTVKAADVAEAMPDGSTLLVGGFTAVGSPRRLIDALVRQGRKDLTLIVNDTARPGIGLAS